MGITDKMGQLVSSVQSGAKTASTSLLGWAIKLTTAFFFALVLSMIGQELMGYGFVSFLFVNLITIAVLLKIMMTWSMGSVLVFDLICVLVALLLRMYILVAP